MEAGRARMPSPAMVVAVIAIVAALGGTAAAKSWRHLQIPIEPVTVVGALPGPAFGDGGQGDCVWGAAAADEIEISGLSPVSFYRDPVATVHLAGVATQANGPGGDGGCGGGDGIEDLVVFVLPPGYRPGNVEVIGGMRLEALVIGEAGAVVAGTKLPPGAVVAIGGQGVTVLDSASFRAAGETDAIGRPPAKAPSLGEFKRAVR
jgi:hypothetical protein